MSAGRHARPAPMTRRSRFRVARWYLLPLPVAAVMALLMPWAVVAEQRRLVRSLSTLGDVLVASQRRNDRAVRRLGDAVTAQQRELDRLRGEAVPPHLHLVK